MTIKRVIFEQEEGGDIKESSSPPKRSNFDAFSDGFSSGSSFKGMGCTILIFIGIVLIIWLI